MADETESLLVRLLARERALFAPFRERHWQTQGVTAGISELQTEYRAKGLRTPQVGTAAERMAAGNRLGDIEKAGLITTAGHLGRRTHSRLSERGRSVAQLLGNAPNSFDGYHTVVELLRFARPGELVSELLLAGLKNYGTPGYQNKLLVVQSLALPGIVAGWLEALSDCHGRAAYRVTPEGEVAAQQPEPTCPPEIANDEMAAFFWAEYDAERERLLSARPSHPNEIGPIPLSAGLWDEVVGPWNWSPKRRKKAKARK